jgi:pyridoxamine 5'-phosphate oxidase
MTSKEHDDIADLRISYSLGGLKRSDLAEDPTAQFIQWFRDAQQAEILEPNAMSLATVNSEGKPSIRTVLLKGVREARFLFFTNYGSRKGEEIAGNPHVAVLFTWLPLQRQVSIRGSVHKLGHKESEHYFHSRPREHQIGAWASDQSHVIPDRQWLEQRERDYSQQFADQPVPLPHNWGGFVIEPVSFEFWQGRPNRLHDRFLYRLENGAWINERLSP